MCSPQDSIAIGWYTILWTKESGGLHIVPSKSNLYSIKDNQQIENVLQLKIENKSDESINYTVTTVSTDLQLTVPINPFPVAASTHSVLPVFVRAPREKFVHGKLSAVFVVTNNKGFNHNIINNVFNNINIIKAV
jgi:hypothetical protein